MFSAKAKSLVLVFGITNKKLSLIVIPNTKTRNLALAENCYSTNNLAGSLDSLECGTMEWNSGNYGGMVGGTARLATRCVVLEPT